MITYFHAQALTTEKTPFQKNFDKISQKGKNPLGLDGMLSNQDHTDSNSSERISTEADYHYHEVCLSSPNLLMRNASIHHEEAFRQRKKVWKCTSFLFLSSQIVSSLALWPTGQTKQCLELALKKYLSIEIFIEAKQKWFYIE